MLAVKLHKRSTPYLGRGSFLVPVLDWSTGRVQVRNWIRMLKMDRRRPNDAIHFITLVRVPEAHPVVLFRDWEQKCFFSPGDMPFRPLREIPAGEKAELMQWVDSKFWAFAVEPGRFEHMEPGGPDRPYPEIVLGAPLPARQVKWTKRIQLLYRAGGKVTRSPDSTPMRWTTY